ncbi:hypothetical protein [uncultured Maribacter sp.]|uniref:hypothetical protein n=1 Tax=uncultured Maribacter sp. TaxID=431308 RepID=UPI00261BFD56|nr:hypothetical protein [uncultured Maribacter sp.]
MSIKKIIYVLVFLVTTGMYCQHKPGYEKIKALKIAYITEKLNLNSKEAQEFWPIYNAHEEQIDKIRRQERQDIFEKLREIDQLSENDLEKLLELDISLKEQKHKLETKFISDVRKVISAKKTFILLQTENGFKRRLIRQYRQKHKSNNR